MKLRIPEVQVVARWRWSCVDTPTARALLEALPFESQRADLGRGGLLRDAGQARSSRSRRAAGGRARHGVLLDRGRRARPALRPHADLDRRAPEAREPLQRARQHRRAIRRRSRRSRPAPRSAWRRPDAAQARQFLQAALGRLRREKHVRSKSRCRTARFTSTSASTRRSTAASWRRRTRPASSTTKSPRSTRREARKIA